MRTVVVFLAIVIVGIVGVSMWMGKYSMQNQRQTRQKELAKKTQASVSPSASSSVKEAQKPEIKPSAPKQDPVQEKLNSLQAEFSSKKAEYIQLKSKGRKKAEDIQTKIAELQNKLNVENTALKNYMNMAKKEKSKLRTSSDKKKQRIGWRYKSDPDSKIRPLSTYKKRIRGKRIEYVYSRSGKNAGEAAAQKYYDKAKVCQKTVNRLSKDLDKLKKEYQKMVQDYTQRIQSIYAEGKSLNEQITMLKKQTEKPSLAGK